MEEIDLEKEECLFGNLCLIKIVICLLYTFQRTVYAARLFESMLFIDITHFLAPAFLTPFLAEPDLFLAPPAFLALLVDFLALLLGVEALWGVPAASPPWAATWAAGAAGLLVAVVLFLVPAFFAIFLEPVAFLEEVLLDTVFLAATFAIISIIY